MLYFIKTPFWLQKIYASCTWKINTTEKIIYLTFDDGPHPLATPFVLETLKKFNAKATFFCIGKNVVAQRAIFEQVIQDGHAIGNHTFNHLNGWKTTKEIYIKNVLQATNIIKADLFRPPYGKVTFEQLRFLKQQLPPFKIIMWSVLSADFDKAVSKEKCLRNVIKNTRAGSIVVFHDSEKASEKLQFALPAMLDYFTGKGFKFRKITFENEINERRNLA